jgi:hypothetical protein
LGFRPTIRASGGRAHATIPDRGAAPRRTIACARAIRELLQTGSHYVSHAEVGCLDDVHTGWILLEAESDEDARRVLPPSGRAAARIVRLTQFSVAELDRLLEHHGG